MNAIETLAVVCHPIAGHGGCYLTVTGTKTDCTTIALLLAEKLVTDGKLDDRDDLPWEIVPIDRIGEFSEYTSMGVVGPDDLT